MLPRGHPQPSPQYTQVSQAIAMSGTEHIRANPGAGTEPQVLGQSPRRPRLLGGSVTPIERGHISTSTPSVHQ